jgi:hypothetical protein
MIQVQIIKHEDQRYPTVGDWVFGEDTPAKMHNLLVSVSQTGNQDYNDLVAVHEIIEAILCKANGVLDEVVTNWDRDHIDHPDPGSIPGCPYYREHYFATIVEKMRASELGVNWDEYEEALEKL